MQELKRLRDHLQMCDELILDALKMRYQIVEDITNYKQEHGEPVVHLDEDERKMRLAKEKIGDDSYAKSILKVYDYIRYRSKKIQSMNIFDGNIFLIGFMGAGKSTISSTLHDVFAMNVIEMDQIIAERNGMTISEIFALRGEEYFRNEETKLLIESQSHKNVIISCGGGVPMREVNIREMKKSGKIILLTASPETILNRVKDSHDRPLLENNKNVEFIADLMQKRSGAYEAAADIIINTDGKTAVEICEEIIQRSNE
ncbi:MAG TPA: chorismate mutase [Lachnospiraceae bacterium]|nr:chorismate mutase [Lachnospiraceae bacterium]